MESDGLLPSIVSMRCATVVRMVSSRLGLDDYSDYKLPRLMMASKIWKVRILLVGHKDASQHVRTCCVSSLMHVNRSK